MEADRFAGQAKKTIGKAEAAIGDIAGDPETHASGLVGEAAGAAQDAYGQAIDALVDAAGSADKVIHSLTEQVKVQPLIALLTAALIGYVFAQLTSC